MKATEKYFPTVLFVFPCVEWSMRRARLLLNVHRVGAHLILTTVKLLMDVSGDENLLKLSDREDKEPTQKIRGKRYRVQDLTKPTTLFSHESMFRTKR